MNLNEYPRFSYRADSTLPDFDDSGPRTVMDARCGLCAKGARRIARSDKSVAFRIIPMQDPLGAALLRHYGMNPEDPTSWLFLEDGYAYTSMDAIVRVGARLGGASGLLRALRFLPRPWQDWLYLRIARNRYRLSRQVDLCSVPDPDVQRRLLRP